MSKKDNIIITMDYDKGQYHPYIDKLLSAINNAIKFIMYDFFGEPNDNLNRSKIDLRINSYLNDIMQDNAIFAYWVTVDETNNTFDIVNMNSIIVDVIIEPIQGKEKIKIRQRLL